RLEELERRQLLSAAGAVDSAIPLVLNSSQALTGVIAQAPTYYAFTVTQEGRLTAEVDVAGGAARLSLLSSDGQVLMQSDGLSPSNPDDLIDLHLTGSPTGTTYYLQVQGLGNGPGSYALT